MLLLRLSSFQGTLDAYEHLPSSVLPYGLCSISVKFRITGNPLTDNYMKINMDGAYLHNVNNVGT
ncbi:hypothetical protein AAZX31_06G155200 [Glycine max]